MSPQVPNHLLQFLLPLDRGVADYGDQNKSLGRIWMAPNTKESTLHWAILLSYVMFFPFKLKELFIWWMAISDLWNRDRWFKESFGLIPGMFWKKSLFIAFWVAHLTDDLAIFTANSFDGMAGTVLDCRRYWIHGWLPIKVIHTGSKSDPYCAVEQIPHRWPQIFLPVETGMAWISPTHSRQPWRINIVMIRVYHLGHVLVGIIVKEVQDAGMERLSFRKAETWFDQGRNHADTDDETLWR